MTLMRTLCRTQRTSSFTQHATQSLLVVVPALSLASIKVSTHCAWKSSIGVKKSSTRREAHRASMT